MSSTFPFLATAVAACSLLAAAPHTAHAASVRAIADVWGDSGSGSGEASGSGDFGSTIQVPLFGDVDLPIEWGTPWDLQVGLLALSHHTVQASLLSSARLTDIRLFDAARRQITDFTLTSASGTDDLAASPVPEPASWMLPGLELMTLRVAQGRRTGTAGKSGAAVAP